MMRSTLLLAFLFFLLLPLGTHSQPHGDAGQFNPQQGAAQLAEASLSFTENRGQWPEQVRLAAQLKGLDLWIGSSSILYDIHTTQPVGSAPQLLDPSRQEMPAAVRRRGHLINMEFIGASGASGAHGTCALPGYRNYFIGNDPARWAANVPTYGSARMQGLYPGIDAVLYFEEGLPRYDIMVAPQADPTAIRIRFNGAGQSWITGNGELAMKTSMGTVYQRKLFAYQNSNGTRRQIPCSFKRNGDGTIGFSLGAYDSRLPLVIDPLVYSTLFGGGGQDGANALVLYGEAINFTGYAGSSSPVADSFPVTYGAYDIVEDGASDLFVAQIRPNGTLGFSTLIGGRLGEEGRDIAVDVSGNLVVCGLTSSDDFPTTAGAFNTGYNGGASDGFVVRLGLSGSLLEYSTFIGGARGDAAYAVVAENNGNVRVCGYTLSDDFPVTPGAYDRSFNGGIDIFSAALGNSGTTLLSATYVGGSGDDIPSALRTATAFGSGIQTLIVGTTTSPDFPTTARAADRTHNGGADVAILRLTPDNGTLDYGSYFGGSRDDHGRDISLATGGLEVFVGGYTASEDFPVSSAAYDPTFNGGLYDAFVAKLNLSTGYLAFSTYVGGSGDDYGQVIAPYYQRIWIAGYTASEDFPTTLPAFSVKKKDGHDACIALIEATGDSLIYSTFFGGEDRDVINDMATVFSYNGSTPRQSLVFCGTTASFGFPTTRNAFDRDLAPRFNNQPPPAVASYDAFVTKLLPANIVLRTETPGSLAQLCAGRNYPIEWASFDINTLQINLLDQSGTRFAAALMNNAPGSYVEWEWLLPKTQPAGTTFRISVRDEFNSIVADTGTIDFEILEGPRLLRGIASVTVCPGDPVELSALAEGLEMTYVWRKNGFTLFGENNAAFRIDSVTAADTGRYELVVLDACDNVALTEIARIDLKPMAGIAAHPQDAETCPGSSASFSVQGEGQGLSYQWYKDGEMIPGATAATLTVDSADQQDNGYYYCEIRNQECPNAPARTRAARLIVFYETIVTEPRDRVVPVGSPVTLSVLVTGLHPTYQWRKDRIPIPGATLSSYSIQRVAFSDAGRYDVVINGECALASRTAIITVTDASASAGERPQQAQGRSLLVQPNPATGRTTIRIGSESAAGILRDPELALYDLLGRKVIDLSASFAENGYLGAEFDATLLPPGIYYCRLAAGGTSIGTTVVITR